VILEAIEFTRQRSLYQFRQIIFIAKIVRLLFLIHGIIILYQRKDKNGRSTDKQNFRLVQKNIFTGGLKMSSSSSNSSSNKINIPEAREALEKFKYEVANEIGVPLKKGYNGDLTSAQNGYVGGYMVNNILTRQHKKFTRNEGYVNGVTFTVDYNCSICVI
jgi:hypothetical protein